MLERHKLNNKVHCLPRVREQLHTTGTGGFQYGWPAEFPNVRKWHGTTVPATGRVGPEAGVELKIPYRSARPSAMEGLAGMPSAGQPLTHSRPMRTPFYIQSLCRVRSWIKVTNPTRRGLGALERVHCVIADRCRMAHAASYRVAQKPRARSARQQREGRNRSLQTGDPSASHFCK